MLKNRLTALLRYELNRVEVNSDFDLIVHLLNDIAQMALELAAIRRINNDLVVLSWIGGKEVVNIPPI